LNNPLLARYAECVFWLARFVERSENLARILEVNETYGRDRNGVQNWLSIVELNADETDFAAKHEQATADSVIRFYVTDPEHPTSIVSAIGNARENARALRPLVSTEMWVTLNVFHNRLKTIGPDELAAGNLSRLLTEIKETCQTFTGITEGTFYRDQAWYFYLLGRYIERADQTTRLLDAKYRLLTDAAASAQEIGQWHALLRSASGYHAFRRVHTSNLTAPRVVGFLLFNPSFPRSVALCVREIDRALGELRAQYRVRRGGEVAECIDALRAILESRSTEQILGSGLHDFIDFLQGAFIELTNRLSAAFFSPGAPDAPAAAPLAPSAQTMSQTLSGQTMSQTLSGQIMSVQTSR
jgi:uncharacterized alpha-E superfamily protein